MLLLQGHISVQLIYHNEGEKGQPGRTHSALGLEKLPPAKASRILGQELDNGRQYSHPSRPPQSPPNPLAWISPEVFMASVCRHSHLSPALFLGDSSSATPQKG